MKIAPVPIFLLCLTLGCHTGPTEHPYQIRHVYNVDDPEFRRTMGALLGPPLISGNATTTLVNGDRIFPPMLEAIRSARKSINFETYIYWSGTVGKAFTDALSERAAAGVKVNLIIDSFGSGRIDKRYIARMRDAGAKVVEYHPLKFYDVSSAQKLNNRTHRKLLVIDGIVGLTGGVGVADEWLGDADSSRHWRDSHYKVTGPIVAQLQAAFCDNWMASTGRVLIGDDYFPPLHDVGAMQEQMFKSGPQGGSESMELLFLLSIAAASKNVRLSSAYFVPDHLTVQTLLEARKRGVSVQIIVPGPHIDEKVVRRASRARWGELLRNGVEIYEYQPTMFHTKLMVVDDLWVSIGSANLDNRSFRLNAEANLNIIDASFAQEQARIFNNDLQRSKPITYEQWQHRPFWEKLIEGTATVLAPIL